MNLRPPYPGSPGRARLGGRIGACFTALLGLGMIAFGLWQTLTVSAAESWPTVGGQVLSSEMSTHGRKGRTQYRCRVSYTFAVNGVQWTGHRLAVGGHKTTRSEVETQLARYAPGAACTVRYDPDDPANCCLEPGSALTGWLLLGLGLVFIAGAAAGVFFGFRR